MLAPELSKDSILWTVLLWISLRLRACARLQSVCLYMVWTYRGLYFHCWNGYPPELSWGLTLGQCFSCRRQLFSFWGACLGRWSYGSTRGRSPPRPPVRGSGSAQQQIHRRTPMYGSHYRSEPPIYELFFFLSNKLQHRPIGSKGSLLHVS